VWHDPHDVTPLWLKRAWANGTLGLWHVVHASRKWPEGGVWHDVHEVTPVWLKRACLNGTPGVWHVVHVRG
jgi:hypothetical protein